MDSENVKVTAEEKDGEEVRDNELPREDEEEDEEEEEEEEMEEGPSGSTAGAFDLPPEAEEPNPEADLVASKLLGFLIKAFIDKTGREPIQEEVASLLEEMTPERVAELLGGNEIVA